MNDFFPFIFENSNIIIVLCCEIALRMHYCIGYHTNKCTELTKTGN